MLVLSLAIVPLLVLPLVVDLSASTESVFFALDWIIWAAFAVEYGVRLYLAPAKWSFVQGKRDRPRRRRGPISPPEGHRNSDHARDLTIHESVLVRTTHGRRGSSTPQILNARLFSLKHSSLG
jgi:hypothetical protein